MSTHAAEESQLQKIIRHSTSLAQLQSQEALQHQQIADIDAEIAKLNTQRAEASKSLQTNLQQQLPLLQQIQQAALALTPSNNQQQHTRPTITAPNENNSAELYVTKQQTPPTQQASTRQIEVPALQNTPSTSGTSTRATPNRRLAASNPFTAPPAKRRVSTTQQTSENTPRPTRQRSQASIEREEEDRLITVELDQL
jgi:hypothetical protein